MNGPQTRERRPGGTTEAARTSPINDKAESTPATATALGGGDALSRLEAALRAAGCTVRGTGATCPAHEDRTASLSIGRRADGTGAVVHCHAGCSVEDVVAALGMRPADLFDAPREPRASERPQVVATYDYVDRDGVLLFQKVRLMPKSFRQRRPDGPGRWSWSLAGVDRVLYRLPELVAAIAEGGTVYLTEGEKDADNLAAAGVTATTWTEGAWQPGQTPKWRHEYTQILRGAHVVIVRDRDAAGNAAAAHIAEQLVAVAASVEVVEAAQGKDASDHLAAGLSVGELVPVAASDGAADVPVPAGEETAEQDKRSAATVLVDLARQRYRFGCTPEGATFGVPVSGGHVVRQLRGGRLSMRAELARAYLEQTGRPPAQQALADAMLALEGEAQAAEPETVHVRVAEAGGAVWIDLGDAQEHAVRIGDGSWQVVSSGVPVLFRRSALTGPMPMPQPGGDLSELWELLNVAPEDRSLVVAYLVQALTQPDTAHPVATLTGEQGTGKSTGCRMLVDLIDPSPVPLRKPPRDMDSWVTAAAGSWVVGLDNLSAVPDWLSDTLCRAVTGDGDVRRQLYTDGGLAVFSFRRVVLVNGIDLGGLRGDLAERMLTIELEPIPDAARRSEADMAEVWAGARPGLLGALLDVAAGMQARLPSVRLDRMPRMADFARVLAALDELNGTDGLARYLEKSNALAADSLTSDPFIAALVESVTTFEGKAADLLELLTPDEARPPKGWPQSPRIVTGTLRRNAPAMRRNGWTVDDLGAGGKDKVTRWLVVAPEAPARPEIAGEPSPPTPLTPPALVSATFPGGEGGERRGKAGKSPISSPPTNRPLTRGAGKAGKAGHEYGQSQDDSPALPVGCPEHGADLDPNGCAACRDLVMNAGW